MSYILDALKRAEAERGELRPKALSEAVGAASQPASAGPKTERSKLWIGGFLAAAVVMAVAASLGWQRWGKETAAAHPADTAAAPVETAQVSAAPPPAPEPLPAPPTPASAPAPAPVLPILAKAPPASPPPPAVSAKPPAAKVPAVSPPPRLEDAEAPPALVEPQPATAIPALSAAARAALPEIQVSGSSYSTNREHRMLIANGQVVKEGQELSPGLTLEVIGPRSAVFNHRGTRFNINY